MAEAIVVLIVGMFKAGIAIVRAIAYVTVSLIRAISK